MNPNAPAINVRVSMAWDLLKTSVTTNIAKVFKDEDLSEASCRLHTVTKYLHAIHYMSIIHQDITAPYAVPTTSATIKETYSYSEVKKCLACKGINLDDLWEAFGIEDIALTAIDTINVLE